MPLKKKEEVCGKPNQYNLQTLEYDWKELPDTHIQIPPQQPRVRAYSLTPAANVGAGPSPQPKLNPITHQPLPSAGVGPAYTPLPSPSKPTQEDLSRNRGGNVDAAPVRYGDNNNPNRRDHVKDVFGEAVPFPAQYTPARASPPAFAPPAPSPMYPYDLESRLVDQALVGRSPVSNGRAMYADGGAVPSADRNGNYAVIPWSHDDIRRVVTSNALEAQRSYLR
jgi:hypothetical protein